MNMQLCIITAPVVVLLLLQWVVKYCDGSIVNDLESDVIVDKFLEGNDVVSQHLRHFITTTVYPEGIEELNKSEIRSILSNEIGSEVVRASRFERRRKYTITECTLAGYNITLAKKLSSDGRIRVYRGYETISPTRQYIIKLFRNPGGYANELAFMSRAKHPALLEPVCAYRNKYSFPGIVMKFVEATPSNAYFKELFLSSINSVNGQDNTQNSVEVVSKSKHFVNFYSASKLENERRESIENNRTYDEDIIEIASKLFDAITYMHWLGYSHSDIVNRHVLIDKRKGVHIIDLEENVQFPIQNSHQTNLENASPDRLRKTNMFQENIDLWSFGTLVATWTVIRYTGEVKWAPSLIGNSMEFSTRLPQFFSKELRQLLFYCFQFNPEYRRYNTVAQQQYFKSLPYWKGVDWKQLRARWNH